MELNFKRPQVYLETKRSISKRPDLQYKIRNTWRKKLFAILSWKSISMSNCDRNVWHSHYRLCASQNWALEPKVNFLRSSLNYMLWDSARSELIWKLLYEDASLANNWPQHSSRPLSATHKLYHLTSYQSFVYWWRRVVCNSIFGTSNALNWQSSLGQLYDNIWQVVCDLAYKLLLPSSCSNS